MSETPSLRWTRRRVLGAGAGAAAGLLLGRCGRGERPPNFLVIMADDLGAECLGSYGGTSYSTPHLDALAASGMRFENAYATPVCTPTRVQLLTGRYPFRTGWTKLIRFQGKQALDPRRERTFGHLLGAAGYATAVAGKWQLCHFARHPDHPRESGFAESRVWTWWYRGRLPSRYWAPGVWENGRPLEGTAGRYGPDLYAEFLAGFMRRHRDRPFLAYYPMVLPHEPYDPTPATVALGRPRDGAGSFAESVAYLDEVVGRLVATLEELGLRERTLVLFTGDNGSPWREVSLLDGREVEGGKRALSEEGTRVPLLASWPGTTPAGAVRRDLTDLSDVFPTLLELAGVPPPAGVEIDGVSLGGRLRGGGGTAREWVYVQLGEKYFVRDRGWRLHQSGRLYDLREDRYRARRVRRGDGGEEAAAARRRLGKVLAGLRGT